MKIGIASDHAGFELKKALVGVLEDDGHQVVDLGTDSDAPVDYPDYALRVALLVADRDVDRGIFICGSGVGGSVVANKVPGVRAGLCHDTYSARQGVEHDDMSLLCLGARVVGMELAIDLGRAFLRASFSNEDRHKRRLKKLGEIEARFMKVSRQDKAE